MVSRQKAQTSEGYRDRPDLRISVFELDAMVVSDSYSCQLEETG